MEVDAEYLDQVAAESREQYLSAAPFPHIFLDNFVREDALEAVSQEIEERSIAGSAGVGTAMDDRLQRKWACNSTRTMGPRTRALN